MILFNVRRTENLRLSSQTSFSLTCLFLQGVVNWTQQICQILIMFKSNIMLVRWLIKRPFIHFLLVCLCACLCHLLLPALQCKCLHSAETSQKSSTGDSGVISLNETDITRVQVAKLVISRFKIIPTAKMNNMKARAKPLRRTRVLKESSPSAVLTVGSTSTSIRSMVSAWPTELPGSSSWVPGHKYMQMFHVRGHEIIIVIQKYCSHFWSFIY